MKILTCLMKTRGSFSAIRSATSTKKTNKTRKTYVSQQTSTYTPPTPSSQRPAGTESNPSSEVAAAGENIPDYVVLYPQRIGGPTLKSHTTKVRDSELSITYYRNTMCVWVLCYLSEEENLSIHAQRLHYGAALVLVESILKDGKNKNRLHGIQDQQLIIRCLDYYEGLFVAVGFRKKERTYRYLIPDVKIALYSGYSGRTSINGTIAASKPLNNPFFMLNNF